MTTTLKKAIAAAGAVFALGLGGCASDGSHRSAGQFTDDAALTAKVKTAIAKDVGMGTAAAINVQSYNGQVQLTGFVDSQDAARRAAMAANHVDGVQVVTNDIHVK